MARDPVNDLLRVYEPLLRTVVQDHAGGNVDFDDAMQDARVVLWQASAEWDGRIPMHSYISIKVRWAMLETVRKVARRARRARMVNMGTEAESIPDEGQDPEEALCGKEVLAVVASVLPVRERALLLRTMAGETLDGVASSMGLSKSWGSRLRDAAVERVRRALDVHEAPC